MMGMQSLGAMLKTIKGKKPKELRDQPASGFVPYLDLSAVELGTQRQWASPEASVVVPPGTLVMVWDGARSGWVGFTKLKGALGSTLAALVSPLNGRFLAAFLRAHFQDINTNYRGSGIPHVNPDYLRALEVPILEEEEQIAVAEFVEAIEQKAATTRTHLGAARRAVDRSRHAMLAAACSGRLTADWRAANPRHPSADELLTKHASDHADVVVNKRRLKPATGLALIDMKEEFPESWAYLHVRELVQLKAILDIQDGNHGDLYPRRTDFSTEGVPFISAESVTGEVQIDNSPRLKEEVAGRLRIGFARARDVILTHNATVGRVAMLPLGAPDVVLSTSTTYYRVHEDVILPEYLLLFMQSHYFQRQLAAVMEQTTRNQVPVTKQVELYLAIPLISEQALIIKRAQRLLTAGTLLLSRIDQTFSRVERSARAVLTKAFRGDLAIA